MVFTQADAAVASTMSAVQGSQQYKLIFCFFRSFNTNFLLADRIYQKLYLNYLFTNVNNCSKLLATVEDVVPNNPSFIQIILTGGYPSNAQET